MYKKIVVLVIKPGTSQMLGKNGWATSPGLSRSPFRESQEDKGVDCYWMTVSGNCYIKRVSDSATRQSSEQILDLVKREALPSVLQQFVSHICSWVSIVKLQCKRSLDATTEQEQRDRASVAMMLHLPLFLAKLEWVHTFKCHVG